MPPNHLAPSKWVLVTSHHLVDVQSSNHLVMVLVTTVNRKFVRLCISYVHFSNTSFDILTSVLIHTVTRPVMTTRLVHYPLPMPFLRRLLRPLTKVEIVPLAVDNAIVRWTDISISLAVLRIAQFVRVVLLSTLNTISIVHHAKPNSSQIPTS